ncbi:hypothetical protein [Streptomyces cyaneofuscatus]|uniref:hypothetical protein n=1 Tax=Streptomyces cyaneofuscatus TaxID=66883 RepID=UPI0033B16A6E
MTREATATSGICWSGVSHRASWTAHGTAARLLRISSSTPPVRSTMTPSGPMRSQSPGSREDTAASLACGSSPASQAPTGQGDGAPGSDRIHSAAREPAAAAAARASSSPSHSS